MGKDRGRKRLEVVEVVHSHTTEKPGPLMGREGGGKMRAGPRVPTVETSRQDPTAVGQGMHQPAGLAWEGRRISTEAAARSHLLSGDRPGTCLDLPHLIGLELRGAVVVNETNTAHQLGVEGKHDQSQGPTLSRCKPPF